MASGLNSIVGVGVSSIGSLYTIVTRNVLTPSTTQAGAAVRPVTTGLSVSTAKLLAKSAWFCTLPATSAAPATRTVIPVMSTFWSATA